MCVSCILKPFCASPTLFQEVYFNLHDFLGCFYGSRDRVTRFLHY
ncbi:hypothetical protein E2C01_094185 [Portunus trituberculatus]|uniref:Uncharacterized protein n=1 Tax=Portunus trituberculatus TaxID=210409 RepID=A0A5B7JWH6_PORTR|nr:hypothetical protein [Portunus trituberculatus]